MPTSWDPCSVCGSENHGYGCQNLLCRQRTSRLEVEPVWRSMNSLKTSGVEHSATLNKSNERNRSDEFEPCFLDAA